jgi:hypothetical protein
MTITLGLLARIAGAVVLAVVLALVASGRLQFDQFTPLVPIPLLPPRTDPVSTHPPDSVPPPRPSHRSRTTL